MTTRQNFDRAEAIVPGTWQNRQGRDEEWEPAPDAAVGMALALLSCVLVLLGALLAVVLA